VFTTKVTKLNLETKTVTCEDGTEYGFKKLLTTMPLDTTLKMVGKEELSKELFYSSSHIIGIGLRGANPHDNKC
jgi:protoporphyrinogen oxidase